MQKFFLSRWAVASVFSIILSACGGGGGGGGGGALSPLPVAGTTPTPATAAAGTVMLSGKASYESVPNASGPLNYAATVALPVRGAPVEIVNATGTVIATTVTDNAGAYAVSVPGGTTVSVRVKAQTVRTGSGPAWDVSVRDNTQSDAIYAMQSSTFSTGSLDQVRDVTAPSGWDGVRYGSTRVAGPFAILDAIYTAQQKVLSAAPAASFPALRVFWSVNNLPASGDVTLGQIGTSHFESNGSTRSIFVLGKENVDTDEYDVSVITHEWGHYYQSSFSRDDSPGGEHALSQMLDRRLAFSEGWGNAFSGIALNRRNYTDSVGGSQAQGASIDLTVGATGNPGWYRESSIQNIFWNLNAQVGFGPIHATMTSDFKTNVAVTDIHSFASSFFRAAPGSASALTGLLLAQSISATPNDPYGQSETNSGSVSNALPLYIPTTLGTDTTACVSNAAGSPNKLGNYVYLRFTAPTQRTYTITVNGPSAAVDPDFVVYGGRVVGVSDQFGQSEAASVALAAGDYVLAINDFQNNSVCLTAKIQ